MLLFTQNYEKAWLFWKNSGTIPKYKLESSGLSLCGFPKCPKKYTLGGYLASLSNY